MKKQFIWILSALLFVAVITGCSAPDGGAAAEAELAACKTVLEEIQGYDSYHIWILCENEGGNVLNDTADMEYWKHGSDWMRVSRIPESGIMDDIVVRESLLAAMCKNGSYFDNMETGTDILGSVIWNPVDTAQEVTPWLYCFDWDAQEVQYISTAENGIGPSVQLRILAPYELVDSVAESYTVEIFFDTDGEFVKAVLSADSGEMSIVDTMYIVSTDVERIAEDIEEQYRKAMG